MQVGDDPVKLEGFRVQQTVDNVLGNDYIDPEMHYELIAGDPDGLLLESKGGIGREYQTITAKKEGIYVIKITYDDYEQRDVSMKDSSYTLLYSNAIDPINTGIVNC